MKQSSVDNWEPIETAPKDEWVLIWIEDFSDIARLDVDYFDKPTWAALHGLSTYLSIPTHWQPLPERPKT